VKDDYHIQSADKTDTFLNSIDFKKLRSVSRKSLPWIIGILLLTNVTAYLFIRWTKPLYQSSSELKLDIKSEASVLGINNPLQQSYDDLAGEIELIRSKLFFNKVIDAVDLEISYHFYGKVLTEERYNNSPFNVDYVFKNRTILDQKFDVEILNRQNFVLSYSRGGKEHTNTYDFGEIISNPDFEFVITLTSNYNNEAGNGNGLYFFIIHSKESLIDYFANNLEVEPVNLNANTIKISLKDHNKYKARDLVNAIDTLYLNYTIEEKNKATRQQISFINEQLEQTEQKLEAFEDYFENFTISNKTTDLQNDIGNNINLMEEIDRKKFEVQNHLIQTEKMLGEINSPGPLAVSPLNLADYPPNIFQAIQNLNTLLQERELLLTSHNPNTLVVQKKVQSINIQRQQLKNLLNDYRKSLTAELKSLNEKRQQIERNFESLPSLGTEYSKNKRLYALYDEFYISQIQKKAEFEIAEAGVVTNFVILSPATLPGSPIYPNKLYVYALGIVSGLVICIAFVLIRYLLHNKISSQSELENLIDAPFLGVVPGIKNTDPKLLVDKSPKSGLSESLRVIRTNMEFMNPDASNKIIAITSTVSGEGKTFISINLGGIIAFSKMKVILVDLDMRKPKIHQAFSQAENLKGVSTILIKKHSISSCINNTSIDNLDYISAGPTPPNPSELIHSDEFDNFLMQLKDSYDMVMLDTPPVGLVTDGMLAMNKADLSIYVVRADYSKKSFVKNINRLINVNKLENLTVVLNGMKVSGSGYGYGYGGYYSSNGYYQENGIEKKPFSLRRKIFSSKS